MNFPRPPRAIRQALPLLLAALAAPLAAQEGSRGNNAPPAEKFAVSPGGQETRCGKPRGGLIENTGGDSKW